VAGEAVLTLGLSPEGLSQATVHLPRRRAPLFVDRSRHLALRVRVSLAPGMTVAEAPAALSVVHRLVTYQRAATWDGAARTLELTKRYRLEPGTIAPDRYAAWTSVAQDIDRADLVHVRVRRVTAPPQGER
jgi:hypothetical protein